MYSTRTNIFLVLLLFILQSCKQPTPPEDGNNKEYPLNLSVVDVSCTEAWLKLQNKTAELPLQINLTLNSNSFRTINLSTNDTVLYADSLKANQTYRFQAFGIGSTATSNELSLTTLDTTSNNFTWQKYTFGTGASSIFRDVAIIDENNIYAVGEIYLNDSTGKPDPIRYNFAVWNGSGWTIKRVPYYYDGQPFYHPIQSVFVFSNSDIWFCGNGIIHWDGKQYNPVPIPSAVWGQDQINKIWGTSSNDLYIVGNGGSIAHYHSGQWERLESGTDMSIHDINGFVNPLTGKTEILCVADDPYYIQPVQVISISENNTAEKLNNTGLGIAISSIWFLPGLRYYIAGNGLYETTNAEKNNWVDLNKNRNITTNFMESIRGNKLNDIIVVGAFGEILHFNGLRWQSIKNEITMLTNGSYYRMAIKGSLVVTVGYNQNKAVILIGHRQ